MAKALASDDREAHEQLAFHYRAGGELDKALPHLIAAGERAAERLGTLETLGFYKQALEAAERLRLPPGPDRLDLLSRLGLVSLVLSELDAAVEYFDAVAELRSDPWRPSAVELVRTRRRAALALISAGNLDGANLRLESAMELLQRVDAADPEWADVLYHLAQLRWHQGRHREAFQIAERCLQAAEAVDSPEAIAKGYEMLALACHSLGEWKKGAAFEQKRQNVGGGQLDVAQAFDVHL